MSSFQLDHWIVDPTRNLIARGRRKLTLEPREMDLLVRLIDADGAVVSKKELLRDVWGDRIVVEHVLPKTISGLRKSFGETARQPKLIQTVHKRGYRLACRVSDGADRHRSMRMVWLRPRSLLRAIAVFGWVVLPFSLGPALPAPSDAPSSAQASESGEQIVGKVPIKIAIATGVDDTGADGAVHDADDAAGELRFDWKTEVKVKIETSGAEG